MSASASSVPGGSSPASCMVASLMMLSATAAPPEFLAGDRVHDLLNFRSRQRWITMGGVPGLQQAQRDESIDVMAKQVPRELCKAAVPCALADALDQRTPFRGWRCVDSDTVLL